MRTELVVPRGGSEAKINEVTRKNVLADRMKSTMQGVFHVANNRVYSFEFGHFNALRTLISKSDEKYLLKHNYNPT
jgi:hypothetical protein